MKIRKHSGINQKTGKLKKGYKYSGKKLKSGLSQIVKVKKPRKRKGGRVLGKGSYGCVIEPAIPCSTSNKLSNKVSKIGLDPTEDNSDEVRMGNFLKGIDPKKKYFIYVEEACQIPKSAIIKEDFKTCKFEVSEDDTYANILMDKGNMDLEKFKYEVDLDDASVSRIILKILKCVEILLEHKVTYYDMKTLNVLIKPKSGIIRRLLSSKKSKVYEAYLIDFGADFMPKSWVYFDPLLDFNTKYLWPREVYSQMEKFDRFMNPNTKKYINKTNFFEFSNKVMVYMIGNMFHGYFKIKGTKIAIIIKKMMNANAWERPNISEARELILKAGYKNKFKFNV